MIFYCILWFILFSSDLFLADIFSSDLFYSILPYNPEASEESEAVTSSQLEFSKATRMEYTVYAKKDILHLKIQHN